MYKKINRKKKYKIDLLLTIIISISATMYLFTEIKKKKEGNSYC